MTGLENKKDVFLVYPGALFWWWEVARESDPGDPMCFETREQAVDYARALAATGPGSVVKFEDWFGATEAVSDGAGRGSGAICETPRGASA